MPSKYRVEWNELIRRCKEKTPGYYSVPPGLLLWVDEEWEKVATKFENVMATLNVDYEDMFPEGGEDVD